MLREYREYERSVTTLVDAAVKPKVAAYVTNIRTPARRDRRRGVPFYVMKSNGGVLSAGEVVHQPITTVLSGPAAGALGAALIAGTAGFDRVLTCDGGGTSTDVTVVLDGEPALTTEGSVGDYPCKIPMIDVVTVGAGGGSIAWLSPEGTLKVGPALGRRRPGPAVLRQRRRPSRPSPTRTCVLGRIPPHLLGGEIPLRRRGRAATGLERARRRGSAWTWSGRATGILEISAWNQANALRQVTVKRGLDVRDFTLTTFGGSGLAAGLPADGHPRPAARAGAARTRATSARSGCSPSTSATTTCRPSVAGTPTSTSTRVAGGLRRPARRRPQAALDGEGFAPRRAAHAAHRRPALRRPGVRGAGPGRRTATLDAGGRRRRSPALPRRAPSSSTATTSATTRARPVEWVNLRVTGIGPIRRPDLRRARAARRRDGPGRHRRPRRVFFDDWVDTPDLLTGPTWRRATSSPGPAIIEEFGSTVPVHPGFAATVDALRQPAAHGGVGQ